MIVVTIVSLKRLDPTVYQFLIPPLLVQATLAIAAEILDHVMVMKHEVYREEISTALGVFLVVWYIAIVSYIFRQFFSYRMSESVIFAFSYFVLTYGIPMLFMDI